MEEIISALQDVWHSLEDPKLEREIWNADFHNKIEEVKQTICIFCTPDSDNSQSSFSRDLPEANAEEGNGQHSNPEADANADISKNDEKATGSTTGLHTRLEELSQELRIFKETTSVEIKTLRNEVSRLEELLGKQGKELVDMSQRLAIVEAEKLELRSASGSLTDRRRRVAFYGSSSK
ncbi:hypothetical protein SI65_08958 [Aspergillus cristatus]|uniref:Uncharacterized protein n=1 Tax=Aspergillus cristatus TaxID=573508 RepID=A0A1E3B474_ASPCR|nr:hypothetical protein SI65_08958 [Aspergillus cristatus]